MTAAELEEETDRVYEAGGNLDAAFEFQKHIMLWVRVLGAERAKECIAKGIDIFDAAVKKNKS